MARRPDDTRGTLIFQEGKNIEGDFYIIAVYDDPASCTIAFCAYELETDCTYSYPLTYSEFDHKFRFDTELMNPSNQDGRFHWVIERLDFVHDARGQKVLCLANEPTPDAGDEDQEDREAAKVAPKAHGVAPAAATGKVDAVTRARLLQELDTHDDEKLHRILVKSEGARKRFLSELFAKRQLEQLKAQQRLQKTDEEREARLAKLDIIKQQQHAKAVQHRVNEEAKKSTMAQLEVLMKQKEAQAIRRLIQEKDEQDRGMGREKDAARQRRKMQERSAAEVQAIEKQRKAQLARKREDKIAKLEVLFKQKGREEAIKAREFLESEREAKLRLREAKERIFERNEQWKAEVREEKQQKRDRFERLEELRESKIHAREVRRAKDEQVKWAELRQIEAERKEVIELRRRNLRKEYLMAWKVEATKRAVAVRENLKRNKMREKRLQEKQEIRLRKFRETQFLDTMRNRSLSPTMRPQEGAAEAEPGSPGTPGASKRDLDAFAKSFEQQERQRRHAEREEKRKQEEAKRSKMERLGPANPNAIEIVRIQEWRTETQEKKEAIEHARLQRELDQEKAKADAAERAATRIATFDQLEQKRREREAEREQKRNEAVTQRARTLPIGTALPLALVY